MKIGTFFLLLRLCHFITRDMVLNFAIQIWNLEFCKIFMEFCIAASMNKKTYFLAAIQTISELTGSNNKDLDFYVNQIKIIRSAHFYHNQGVDPGTSQHFCLNKRITSIDKTMVVRY